MNDPTGCAAWPERSRARPLGQDEVLDVDTWLRHCVHMDVGVRELKQHLSEYLERAAAGETIRVTDRGQPKALLGPVPGSGRLALGITQGWIRSAEESEPARVPRAKALRSIADVVGEDRDG